MINPIVLAFQSACREFSVDRVVADPELNAAFIEYCRTMGLEQPSSELNRKLLNLRKAGHLQSLSSKRTILPETEDVRFAAEVAIRFLERRDSTTLDAILCDPEAAAEFDSISAEIAPGYSPLVYRWSALGLRKQRRLRPEIVARIAPSRRVERFSITGLDPNCLPQDQGLYIFISGADILYVGEATNLRKRLRKHLDHSDNKGLARWLWENGSKDLHLEIHVLDSETQTRARKALEAELIASRKPVFNVKMVISEASQGA